MVVDAAARDNRFVGFQKIQHLVERRPTTDKRNRIIAFVFPVTGHLVQAGKIGRQPLGNIGRANVFRFSALCIWYIENGVEGFASHPVIEQDQLVVPTTGKFNVPAFAATVVVRVLVAVMMMPLMFFRPVVTASSRAPGVAVAAS